MVIVLLVVPVTNAPFRASLLGSGIEIVLGEDKKVSEQCFSREGDLAMDSLSIVVQKN